MLEILKKQLELTPGNTDLVLLIGKAEAKSGRTVKIKFESEDDIAFFSIRVEVRDHEDDLVGMRIFYNAEKVPHIHDELIRLGEAHRFYQEVKERTEADLVRLRESLMKHKEPA